jgi:hypothetical protein
MLANLWLEVLLHEEMEVETWKIVADNSRDLMLQFFVKGNHTLVILDLSQVVSILAGYFFDVWPGLSTNVTSITSLPELIKEWHLSHRLIAHHMLNVVVVWYLNTIMEVCLKIYVDMIVIWLLPLCFLDTLKLLLGVRDEEHLISWHCFATAVKL